MRLRDAHETLGWAVTRSLLETPNAGQKGPAPTPAQTAAPPRAGNSHRLRTSPKSCHCSNSGDKSPPGYSKP